MLDLLTENRNISSFKGLISLSIERHTHLFSRFSILHFQYVSTVFNNPAHFTLILCKTAVNYGAIKYIRVVTVF